MRITYFADQMQRTPLYAAVQLGDPETVKALLEAGSDACTVSKVSAVMLTTRCVMQSQSVVL